MLSTALQTVKDILFPVFCLGCNTEGVVLCDTCKEQINCAGAQRCPVCHELCDYGTCCEDCTPYSALNAHLAGVVYAHDTLIARLIEALKYQFVTDIAPVLVSLLTPTLTTHQSLLEHVDIVVPVPLHPRREAERGFNQATLIAEGIGQAIAVPIVPALRRVRYTKQQARLAQEARVANVTDIFALSDTVQVAGMTVLLVDDVFTTGSTIQSAASALRASGADSVIGMSVARG